MEEPELEEGEMELREYASKEHISLGTAYRRIWEGRIRATKHYGRWVILQPQAESNTKSEVSNPVTKGVE